MGNIDMLRNSLFNPVGLGKDYAMVLSSADDSWGVGTLVCVPFDKLLVINIDRSDVAEPIIISFQDDDYRDEDNDQGIIDLPIYDMILLGDLEKWATENNVIIDNLQLYK